MTPRTLATALLALAGCATGAPQLVRATDAWELHRAGARCYAFFVRPGQHEKWGANSGFIVTSQGVVVIDTHGSEEAAKQILGEIRAVTAQPVRYVVSTHWHDDHVAGNGAYAGILMHEGSAALYKGAVTAVSNDRALFDGADRIEVLALGRAHSAGDLAVWDPIDRVLYMGDAYVNGYVGYLCEGWYREWVASLDRMLALGARVVVPGHGPIAGPEPMRAYRDYIDDFRGHVRGHFRRGGTPEAYRLPSKYDHLGARFFLKDNVARAFELWKAGALDD